MNKQGLVYSMKYLHFVQFFVVGRTTPYSDDFYAYPCKSQSPFGSLNRAYSTSGSIAIHAGRISSVLSTKMRTGYKSVCRGELGQ